MMNLKYYLRGLGIGIVVTALIMGIATGGRKQVLSDEEIMERAKELGMVEESTVLADTVAGQSANAASGSGNEANDAEKSEVPTPLEKTPEPKDGAEKTSQPKDVAEKTLKSKDEVGKTPQPKDETEKTPAPSVEKEAEKNESESLPVSSPSPDAGEENRQASSPTPTPAKTPLPDEETIAAAGEETSQPGIIQVNSGEGSYTVCLKLQEAGLISSASEFDRYLAQNGFDRKIRTGVFEIPGGADQETIAKIITRTE